AKSRRETARDAVGHDGGALPLASTRMVEIRTDFPYLGAREYIHGTSILSGFLDALDEAGQPVTEFKRLKFQRPATSNGRLFLTTAPIEAGELEAANSVFLA